jgi:D-alanyl-D-alanine dipeptidase
MTALHRTSALQWPADASPTGRARVVEPEAETAWLGELVRESTAARVSLARGGERAAVQLALRQGVTDASRLTDLVFQGRHPERSGRPIGHDEQTLAREWVDIRDHVVRPLLAAASVAAPGPMAPPAPASGAFRPVPVESPGGGRVRDKRDPAASDVTTVRGVNGPLPLHRLAGQAWAAMVSAARADGIAEPLLLPVSGYRSSQHQTRLWQGALKRYGSPEEARKWVAPPGSSAHQSGRAIDLYLGARNDSSNVQKLRQMPAYLWLAANARRFGFYPYEREPWHWEYNPPAAGATPELEQSWLGETSTGGIPASRLEWPGATAD